MKKFSKLFLLKLNFSQNCQIFRYVSMIFFKINKKMLKNGFFLQFFR